jgi:hypothetical protein
MVMGLVQDRILQEDNKILAANQLPYSFEHAQAMGFLATCFKFMAIVALISAGILLIMNGVQSTSGEI